MDTNQSIHCPLFNCRIYRYMDWVGYWNIPEDGGIPVYGIRYNGIREELFGYYSTDLV